jgi:hypothetical protein
MYTRSLVTGNEVYVIMGNYGTGGTGSNGALNVPNINSYWNRKESYCTSVDANGSRNRL